MCEQLRSFVPVDEEGLRINDIVAFIEHHPESTRVAEIAERFGLNERSLQRLVQRRIGLTPKWLIQRRRLHDAAARLRDHHATGAANASLADVASDLGYADQAHFTRDFHRVTGITPGEFAARHR